MKKSSAVIILTAVSLTVQAGKIRIQSPDGNRSAVVNYENGHFSLNVLNGNTSVFDEIQLALETDFDLPGKKLHLNVRRGSVNQILHPEIWIKSAAISDQYNYAIIKTNSDKCLEVRAFDNGIAWRWTVSHKGQFKVLKEIITVRVASESMVWNNNETTHHSENQCTYTKTEWSEVPEESLFSTPLLFEINGTKYSFMESGLVDYAGLWFRKTNYEEMSTAIPAYPSKLRMPNYFGEYVDETESYISSHQDTCNFPWRIIGIADNDADLLINQLVYQLAEPARGDYSWVKPGKVAWEWLADMNIIGVDFKAGENTETYRYYVDFASAYGIEYILLDGGWFDATKGIRTARSGLNVKEVCDYAHSKGVDVLIWAPALLLRNDTDATLDLYKEWGISGVKIDFFCRDDQPMIRQMTQFAKACAEHHLTVDFHGCPKPAGLMRTYPNVLNYEAVFGWEQAKCADTDKNLNPDHNVTIPFIRLLAGPMDYTPGSMDNYKKEDWHLSMTEPSSIGTRCHQLAMYVIYDAPLQMLADSPYKYYREPKSMEFLSEVPTVWEESVPLDVMMSDHIVMARKSKTGEWYLGAMNDDSGKKSLEISLAFLDNGTYKMKIWKDGINSDRNPRDIACEEFIVTHDSKVKIELQRGGGYAAIISKCASLKRQAAKMY